ncbi:MAG: hypothetical protein HQM16_13820 [Deltaproteobacteria bacterium]|nr:hypothetical protein [Deltaproteobacteria bacterium]
MSEINLKNIQPRCGSQQHAFEELCCQLARRSCDESSEFVRLDGPLFQESGLDKRFSNVSIGEQQQIVSILVSLQEKVSKLKKMQDKTSLELNALMPSILDRAFRGKL